ncbi:MAG TPA: ABC transporter ATP-binding protein [Bauldia sp.]|nr:ABC transporter ATP-binding protein [Bauldia sp.]
MRGSGVAGVRIEAVEKHYPARDRAALSGVTLEVPPGSFFSILGPSGCGKTTLLRIVAGFEQPSAGRVIIGGEDVSGVPPRDRDIAMVFQDYALYPHMTVRQNMTFSLRNRRVGRNEIDRRLSETAAMLGIEAHLDKLPGQLSGGERQRVALGRALIRQPRVFLMDEPLSNLDLKLRETMRIELGRLHQRLGITILFVTHDQAEAMTLSTAVAVMSQGELQQVDRPEAIYARPANTFVARFIGSPSMNIFRATFAGGQVVLAGAGVAIEVPGLTGVSDGAPVLVGARPHELFFADAGPGRLTVQVGLVEHLGRSNFVVCAPEGGPACIDSGDTIQVETEPGRSPELGTAAHVGFDVAALKFFDQGGKSLHYEGDTRHLATARERAMMSTSVGVAVPESGP